MTLENTVFISTLIDKLSKGNRNSIQLNAQPGRSATRLDITEIDKLIRDFSSNFLQKLTSESNFSVDVSIEQKGKLSDVEINKTIKRLESISRQNNDYFLEHGVETFGFGYPILIKTDPSDPKNTIRAPLFIWSLKIEESRTKVNTYKITRLEDYQIRLNEVLISFLDSNDRVKINKLNDDILEDSVLDLNEIKQVVAEIIEAFNIDKIFDPKLSFTAFSEFLKIESTLNNSIEILNSGVFGLFLMQKESIINDLKTIQGGGVVSNNLGDFNFSERELFSMVETDPSQQKLLNELSFNNKFIVHGPPGTGKSQTLTAIISNLISNGLKCLVVCEKRTALEVIYENLKKEGLQEIVALVEDPTKDRKWIVDNARNVIDSVFVRDSNNSFNYFYYKNEHENLIESIFSKTRILDATFDKSDLFVLEGKKWKDIVADFFSNSDRFELIEGSENFKFDEQEFYFISKLISESNYLFSQFKPLKTSLNYVDFQYFKGCGHFERSNFFEKELSDLWFKVNSLLHNFENLNFDEFGTFKYRILALFSVNAKENIKFHKNYLKLVKELNKLNGLKLDLEMFSKSDELKLSLNEILIILEGINSEKNSIPYFENWLDISSKMEEKYVNLLHNLSNSDSSLDLSFKKWFYGNLLNSNTLKFAEGSLGTLDEELKLNKTFIKNKALSFWEKKRVGTIQNFNDKKSSLTAKQLYSKSSTKSLKKKTLRQIIKVDFDLFTDIFPVVLVNPSVCSSLFDLKRNLFDAVIFDEASQLRIEDTYAALIRGKIKVVSGDEKQMPPSSYFSSTEINIDEANDDEAFQEDNIGQDFAMKESLLEFASDSEFRDINLNMHYRSKHPRLIDFSNAAFYGNSLIPMPAYKEYIPINYVNVLGVYKDRSNLDEAQKIISILEYEINVIDDDYPSVGIATFNLNQRNLILELINKRCIESESFRNKILLLEKKDFFVKNLENIQGDERDIIIISTTFARNGNGKFIKSFGPVINKTKGFKLLNVLVTRAKIKQIVVTSFPEEEFLIYKSLIKLNGISGQGVLFAYLAYSKAVSDNNLDEINDILETLSAASASEEKHSFNRDQEVSIAKVFKDKLLAYGIPEEYLFSNYTFGGFKIDLFIDFQSTKIAIDFDGSNFKNIKNNYHSLLFKKKQMATYGINYQNVWSIKFWQNESYEINKILNLILK